MAEMSDIWRISDSRVRLWLSVSWCIEYPLPGRIGAMGAKMQPIGGGHSFFCYVLNERL